MSKNPDKQQLRDCQNELAKATETLNRIHDAIRTIETHRGETLDTIKTADNHNEIQYLHGLDHAYTHLIQALHPEPTNP